MGYQPRNELRELAAKAEFWHMMVILVLCTFISFLVFIPALLMNNPDCSAVWAMSTIILSIPFLFWSHGKTRDIAVWWVMRPENKKLAEQNAKVLRNRIIRESEEFIMECRGKNEIQS